MKFRYMVVAVGLLAISLLLFTTQSGNASAAPQLVAAFGKANIGGEEIIVHTVSVVPTGKSPRDVANASLAAQGARPLTSSEFTETGLTWTDGGPADLTSGDGIAQPVFNYNPSNDSLNGASESAILAGLYGWNDITSNFAFEFGGYVNTCPSLVRECPGRQVADGSNDIGWILIKEQNTLAVTWYNTGSKEADVAFSTRHSWFIDGEATGNYDVQTVALHEFGHGLGLGHSDVSGAVMEAYYGGVIHTPEADDIAGVLAIYEPGATTPTPTPTSEPGDPAADLAVSGVDYSLSGKRNRDLVITVGVEDDNGAAVASAGVLISVYLNGSLYGTGGPTSTDSDGNVRWRVRNASSGIWTTVVESINKGDLTCSTCPDNSDTGFVKP